jgi:hypothetical protein
LQGVFIVAVLTDLPQNTSSLSWWLEVGVTRPLCIYYFGPFSSQLDATSAQNKYFEDLKHQNMQIVYAAIKFCQPRQLIIHENELTIHDFKISPPTFFEALVMR